MRYIPRMMACTVLILSACSDKPAYQTITGQTMGTSYHIHLKNPSTESDMTDLQDTIDARLQEINDSMSTYQSDSTISRFNRAKKGVSIPIDADFIQVLSDARQVYELSNQAFDPTVYPLVELWGFGGKMSIERLQSPPNKEQIEKAKQVVGLDKVILNGNQLSKRIDGVGLDFSAIAKGYAVDVIANTLHDNYGITDYMVEIGGEVATRGVNDKGRPWKIGIDMPMINSNASNRSTITTLTQLKNQTLHVATSGGYRNAIEYDGVRYSHTISPVTGKPVAANAPSVTVLHDTAALADAWATALTAMPYVDALALANKETVEAVFVVENASKTGFEVVKTEAAQQKFGK